MFCRYCRSELPSGASICPVCHARVNDAPVGQYMYCPHCRSQLPFGVSVCPVCNARLNTTEVFNDSNGTAVAALAMALLSFFFPLLVIPAIVCGHIGLANSRRTLGKTGEGMAIAALIIGYLTVAVWALILLVLIGGLAALFAM